MKQRWYGDKRDIVKWGTLAALCERSSIRRVLYVAMLTEDQPKTHLTHNGEPAGAIPEEVWSHFRDISQVKLLGESLGIQVELISHPFQHKSRNMYFQRVVSTIRGQPGPLIAFLDPDTGIEPNKATVKHVKCQEVAAIWQALPRLSHLVVYQHRPREADWQDAYRAKLSKQCGTADVDTFESQIASDVAFFVAKKI